MSLDGSVERQRANERRSATQKQNAKRRKLTARWDTAAAQGRGRICREPWCWSTGTRTSTAAGPARWGAWKAMRLQDDLERIAAGMAALRVVHGLMRERDMAGKPLIEIKGLGSQMAGVRDGIRGLRKLVADVNDSAGGFAAELQDVHAQIESARDDLRFEAETLGNSSGASQGSQNTAEVPKQPDDAKTAPTAAPTLPVAAPEVPAVKPTFPGSPDPGAAA